MDRVCGNGKSAMATAMEDGDEKQEDGIVTKREKKRRAKADKERARQLRAERKQREA